MRILHVTPRPLPDIRVERAILSDKHNGYEVHLAAPAFLGSDLNITLDGFYELRFTIFDKAGFRVSRRRLANIVREVRPDIIHAHDFPAAWISKELAHMIYDAHEDRIGTAYHRARVKIASLLGRTSKLFNWVALWFKQLNVKAAEDVVVVAPSKPIVDNFVAHGARKGFVLPNFPHRFEVPKIDLSISKDVLHGALDRPKYLIHGSKFPWRAPIEGFPEKFSSGKYGKLLFAGGVLNVPNVISLGFVKHIKLYEKFKDIRTFIVHRRPNEVQRMLSPNRVYVMVQVGAVPIIPSTIEQVIEYIPESITFDSAEEFRSILEDISERSADEWIKMKERIMERADAVKRLDDVQREAYKAA